MFSKLNSEQLELTIDVMKRQQSGKGNRSNRNLSPLPTEKNTNGNKKFVRRFDSFGRRVSFSSAYDSSSSESDFSDEENVMNGRNSTYTTHTAHTAHTTHTNSNTLKSTSTNSSTKTMRTTITRKQSKTKKIEIHRSSGGGLTMSQTVPTPRKGATVSPGLNKVNNNKKKNNENHGDTTRKTPIIRRISHTSDGQRTSLSRSLSSPKGVNALIKRFEKHDSGNKHKNKNKIKIKNNNSNSKSKSNSNEKKPGKTITKPKITRKSSNGTKTTTTNNSHHSQKLENLSLHRVGSSSDDRDTPVSFESPANNEATPHNGRFEIHPGFISPAPGDFQSGLANVPQHLPQLTQSAQITPIDSDDNNNNNSDKKGTRHGYKGQKRNNVYNEHLDSPNALSPAFVRGMKAIKPIKPMSMSPQVHSDDGVKKSKKDKKSVGKTKDKKDKDKSKKNKHKNKYDSDKRGRKHHSKNNSGLHMSSPGFNNRSVSPAATHRNNRGGKKGKKNKKSNVARPKARDLKMKQQGSKNGKTHEKKGSQIIVTEVDIKENENSSSKRKLIDLKINTANGGKSTSFSGLSPYSDVEQKYHRKSNNQTPSANGRKTRRYSCM